MESISVCFRTLVVNGHCLLVTVKPHRTTLYANERLSLGGQYSVRGFKEQYLTGNRGGYWRNELKRILSDKKVVQSPIIRTIQSNDGIRYERVVITEKNDGN